MNATVIALYCASSAPDEAAWKSEALGALEELGKEALAFEGVLADDKSGLYEALVDAREHAKDEAGVKALGLQWLQFLEAEAGKAPTQAARAAFDAHRVNASIAAGMPQRAEAALKQSAADFPEDYNPLARLALIYKEQGKLDEALEHIEKGLEKAYGPRKLRLFEIKAQVLEKKADKAGQKATLKKALDYGKGLPAPQRPEKALARIEAGFKAIP